MDHYDHKCPDCRKVGEIIFGTPTMIHPHTMDMECKVCGAKWTVLRKEVPDGR